MARTTSAAVQGIIKTKSSISLDPFIEAASALVTGECADATDGDGNAYYNAAGLELIERWLAAHFYAIRDPRRDSDGAGSVRAKYRSKVDVGFDVTHYGQMAMRLDRHGGLAALNSRMKAGGVVRIGATWMGLTPSEEPTDLYE